MDIVDTVKTFFIIIVGIRRSQQVPLGAIDTELAILTIEAVVLGHWRVIDAIFLTCLVSREWPRRYLAVIVGGGAGSRVER